MKNKKIFFIFLVIISFCSVHDAQAMLLAPKLFFNLFKGKSIKSSEQDCYGIKIRNYKPRFDEEAVKKIAMQYIPKLVVTYDHSEERYEKIWKSKILLDLDDPAVISKVCTINDTPIAFMSYFILDAFNGPPHWMWNSNLTEKYAPGINAYFAHLAVDNEYQGMGCGTALLNHALDSCKQNSVDYITFETTLPTSPELCAYYQRFGFKIMSYKPDRAVWGKVCRS
ncbi:GNAT family N-acetyltransferase [Candidatus Dependentiae bacterium]|nr:GNAT family N-acetyltransferase [Candidatus Dependentiae bacterium]